MSQQTQPQAQPAPAPAVPQLPSHDLYRQVEQTIQHAQQLADIAGAHFGGQG
jgi:hypothetical protein